MWENTVGTVITFIDQSITFYRVADFKADKRNPCKEKAMSASCLGILGDMLLFSSKWPQRNFPLFTPTVVYVTDNAPIHNGRRNTRCHRSHSRYQGLYLSFSFSFFLKKKKKKKIPAGGLFNFLPEAEYFSAVASRCGTDFTKSVSFLSETHMLAYSFNLYSGIRNPFYYYCYLSCQYTSDLRAAK